MIISNKQIEQVNDRIQALRKANSFYGKKLEDAGISGNGSFPARQTTAGNIHLRERANAQRQFPYNTVRLPEIIPHHTLGRRFPAHVQRLAHGLVRR